AGAVGPQESEDRPRTALERDVVDRRDPAALIVEERLAQMLYLDHDNGGVGIPPPVGGNRPARRPSPALPLHIPRLHYLARGCSRTRGSPAEFPRARGGTPSRPTRRRSPRS